MASSLCFLFVQLFIITQYCCICCPNGYTFCADEGATCTATGIVAYGSNTYTYQNISGSVHCGDLIFGDPAPGTSKQCCYQDPVLSGPSSISPLVRSISCGDQIYGYMKDTESTHYYQLITDSIYDITYNDCNTPFDATLTVYNSNGIAISLNVCPGSMSRPNYGDDCDVNHICSKEVFTLQNQMDDTYYIRIAYYTSFSPWHDDAYSIKITCSGTLYPTSIPTHSPSNVPTKTPSKSPTQDAPSTSPTKTPTNDPTLNPTKSPTKLPTQLPTFTPSLHPTINPTTGPTSTPSINPSLPPGPATYLSVFKPSYQPTANPVNVTSDHEVTQLTAGTDDDVNNANTMNVDMIIIGIIIGIVIICIIYLLIWCKRIKKNKKKNLIETIELAVVENNNNSINSAPYRIQSVCSVNTDNDYIINGGALTNGAVVHAVFNQNDNNNEDDDEEDDIVQFVNDKVTQKGSPAIQHNDAGDDDIDILNNINHVTIGDNEVNESPAVLTNCTNNDNVMHIDYVNHPNLNEDEFIVGNDVTNGYDGEGE